MSFRAGQSVWIGWTPDESCGDDRARQYRCAIGEIESGPYPPNHRGKWAYENPFRSWNVRVDGVTVNAAEFLLSPFHDPDPSAETTHERSVTA